MGGSLMAGFELPLYPYDRLDNLRQIAAEFSGGCVDLSVGSPSDATPNEVTAALADSDAGRSYPASIGSTAFRSAAASWLSRRFDIETAGLDIAACVGTKEFVASVPRYLRLYQPERDTVLYPAVSYPTYAMGAVLSGCRAVPVPLDKNWHLDLTRVSASDAARALCLWVNSPANPTGVLENLAAAVTWGHKNQVPILSDECYIEFTWAPHLPQSILQYGSKGILAVHSLSKRSNMAGLRAGFFVGDPELVRILAQVRKHAGLMIPGPVQQAAVVAFSDDTHVQAQQDIYRSRLVRLAALFQTLDPTVKLPEGGFYLWLTASDGNGWGLARRAAKELGALISPGEFYGTQGNRHARVAAVAPDDQIDLLEQRIAAHSGSTLKI